MSTENWTAELVIEQAHENTVLKDALRAIKVIAANSGTNLNAWNKALDVIDDALREAK